MCHPNIEIAKAISDIYVYSYMYVDKKYFGSYFSDRLTFSNIRGRTSCQIYRLALPLAFSRNASSLSKLIFLYNAYLALFVLRVTQLCLLNSNGKYRHLVN